MPFFGFFLTRQKDKTLSAGKDSEILVNRTRSPRDFVRFMIDPKGRVDDGMLRGLRRKTLAFCREQPDAVLSAFQEAFASMGSHSDNVRAQSLLFAHAAQAVGRLPLASGLLKLDLASHPEGVCRANHFMRLTRLLAAPMNVALWQAAPLADLRAHGTELLDRRLSLLIRGQERKERCHAYREITGFLRTDEVGLHGVCGTIATGKHLYAAFVNAPTGAAGFSVWLASSKADGRCACPAGLGPSQKDGISETAPDETYLKLLNVLKAGEPSLRSAIWDRAGPNHLLRDMRPV